MTQKQKVEYTRLALAMVGIVADEPACESIILTLDEVRKKGGSFTLREAAIIRAKVKEKYDKLRKRKQ